MLRYSWPKIFVAAEGSAFECMRIMHMLVFKKIPENKYDKTYYYSMKDFRGESFLLHPDVLLFNAAKYTHKDACIYIALASLRSYAEYKVSGTLTLPMRNSPVDPHEYLTNKSLLPVKHDLIHFPYEEVPESKEIH